jgi:hypothetical protein
MKVGLTEGMQALLPRTILYTILGTLVAWLYYLIRPALEAALSRDYRSFSWVSEKRGVGSFLKSTWEVAFKSTELFAEIHRKVRPSQEAAIQEVEAADSGN